MQEEVDGVKLLLEADKLNSLIHILMKDLKWQVIPACTVLSSAEIKEYGDNFVAVQEEFKKRCELLRASGTLVLRGMMAIDRVPNLTPQHLHPIRPSVWRTLSWSTKNPAPPSGHYGVPKIMLDEHNGEVQSAVLNFCLTCL
ncbi:Transcription factor GTE10 [Frankliniella fusca]|uniref:Transcription factor GTE10 n=1 Tax=Frankliniella fusca TaxID=407009 RepID=A0AAE1LFQ5_9NEOP|nr:Transcription factor GTE10 [Frankliniella fusca]KAK3918003.1 Transcription factor GTE10 [Frankliniella fusca]